MKVISRFFQWLQKDAPTGVPYQFPELIHEYETSVPGIYCIGDLTGVPLIKLASESGYKVIQQIEKSSFLKKTTDDSSYDLIVCGAGPAGVAATIEAQKKGWKVLLLEAARPFNTLYNFPKGKPIFVTPKETPFHSALPFHDGTKETLLKEYEHHLKSSELPLKTGVNIESISDENGQFSLRSSDKCSYKASTVIVAIGSSGNARRLNCEGEDLPKVYNKLIDPAEFADQRIVVVGGGDSALESAIALAEVGNKVSVSYRKDSFARPKAHNIERIQALEADKKLTIYYGTTVRSIHEQSVILKNGNGAEVKIENDTVFTMIGTEIPIQFFKRSKIKMEGEKSLSWWIQLSTMVLFFSMLYFGKAGNALSLISADNSLFDNITSLLKGPFSVSLNWSLDSYAWLGSTCFIIGWLSTLLVIPFSLASLGTLAYSAKSYFSSPWNIIKYSYLTIAAILFAYIYISSVFTQTAGWVQPPTYWYALLYCSTMLLFGVRRMVVKRTKYVTMQTSTLIFIQIFFLFLLPFHLYEPLIANNFAKESWIIREVFPKGGWSSFGLILFWPLNINDFGSSTFWTWFPMVQTFVVLPLLIRFFGKGVYCGWICSCGGMAETLGDEYRHKAPHGPNAKKWENAGQIVLLFAFIATGFSYFGDTLFSETLWGSYKLLVDIIFAGVLGLGIYFFYSGRIWCRYFCPLAALMHIYTKFSRFRIFADKKKCISCNLCTKSCHMGIDVMSFANKGKPMDDVECVACSSCITSCPMDVLSFGRVEHKKK